MNKFFGIFILSILSFSCSSDLDFDQNIGDLSPYFEMTDFFNAEVFNNTTSSVVSYQNTYDLIPLTIPFNINDKLTDNGIVQNIKEVVFHVTFINTTNNKCLIKVAFLTDNSTLTKYTTTIDVLPNETKTDIFFLENDIPNLKSVTNIQITGSMTLTGSIIPLGKLSVNSDATIYLKL
jgi:hypothetical protein